MLGAKEAKLLSAIEPRALAEGIEIVTIEIVGGTKSPTIRVYIDTPDGVSFDELASAQSWINDIVDEIDPFPGAYMLEVSSPGIDRPLRTLEHFARFAGEEASIKVVPALEGRKSWSGVLAGVDGDAVLLSVGDEVVPIPLDIIKRARLKGVVDFSSKERKLSRG